MIWPALLFVGVLTGATFGMLLMLLRRDRGRDGGIVAASPVLRLGMPSFMSAPNPPKTTPTNPIYSPVHSIARSATVGLSPTQVMRSMGKWKLWVRVVSPPGAFVSFSRGNSPGDAITIPTGGFQEMWLDPEEDLYAQSTVAHTTVSVSGGEI